MHSTFDIYDKLNCALAEILQMQSHTAAAPFFFLPGDVFKPLVLVNCFIYEKISVMYLAF